MVPCEDYRNGLSAGIVVPRKNHSRCVETFLLDQGRLNRFCGDEISYASPFYFSVNRSNIAKTLKHSSLSLQVHQAYT